MGLSSEATLADNMSKRERLRMMCWFMKTIPAGTVLHFRQEGCIPMMRRFMNIQYQPRRHTFI